jgi:ankyrin repeat protein
LQQYNVSGDHNHKITDISIPISESTLHTAAEFGQTYEVMQLLQKPDLDIDAYVLSVEGGLTSLHYAVKNGHLDIVKALLAHGASIDIPTTVGNAKICKGKSPFLLALIYGHIDVARFLEAKGADINKSDAAGQTAVHLATRHNVAMLDYLLHIPKQSHTLSSKTAHGKTVLMDAAYWGICDTFAYVLNHSGVESIVSQGNNGENCLHWAVKSMSQNTAHKIIQMLKDTAIDPYIRDHAGYTPLHCAAMESRYSVFKAILEYTEKWSLAEPSIHDPFIFTTIIGYPYLQDFRSQWLPHNIGARTLEHLTSSGKSVIHLILERPMSKENLCKIQLLMKKGINMDFQDARGRTPLLALCSRIGDGDPNAEVEAFELLLSHTANIAHQDFDGNTPLHYLCQRAYHQELACRCILYILEVSSRYDETHQSIAMDQYLDRDRRPHFPAAELDGKSSVNSLVYTSRKPSAKSDLIALMNNNEANALSLFFELRNLSHPTAFETALKLLEATSQVQLNSVFPNGKCPLIISIRQGIDSLTRKLIDMGADVTASEGPPIIRPISALEQLCISGSKDLSVIKSIVYGNKNSFPRNTSGESRLLEIACTNGHISVLEQLLIAGWNPNSLREDHSPLFSALRSGHEQALVLLLDYGASISDEICGYLSLGEASSAALCKVLHDRGIDDWDLRNKRKNYFWGPWIKGLSNEFRRVWLTRPIGEIAPLHYAAWRGSTECIEYALEFGKYVNINVHAEFNLTPLFFAVFGGHQSSVELLLGHGANAKEIYKPYGWTPLHVAVSSGSIAAVTKLMGAGADGRISDFDGITPSMLAKQQGKTSIAQVIDTETAKLRMSNTISIS